MFECVRESLLADVRDDLKRGAVFYDLHHAEPYRLDIFSATVRDGLGRCLHRKLFVVQTSLDGTLAIRQPTIFLDLALAPKATPTPKATPEPTWPVTFTGSVFLLFLSLSFLDPRPAAWRHLARIKSNPKS